MIPINKLYYRIEGFDDQEFKYKNYRSRIYNKMLVLRLYSRYGAEQAIYLMTKKLYNPESFSGFLTRIKDMQEFKDIIQSKIEHYGSKTFYVLDLFGALNRCKSCQKYCERTFCSTKCSKKYLDSIRTPEDYKELHAKMNATSIKKYGSLENAKRARSLKSKATNFERYGKWYSQTEEGRKASSKATPKAKVTQFEKYGMWYCQTEEGRKKASEGSRRSMQQRRQTWDDRYGGPPGQQHIANKENLNKDYILNNFIEDGLFLIEDFCKYFNVSQSHVFTVKKQLEIKIPNKTNKLKAQLSIFNFIEAENKISNDKSLIYPKEIDILLPDYKLAIEYNGLMFHSQGTSKYTIFNNPDNNKNSHLKKTNLCESKGYQLFHIFENEDIEIWKSMINNKLGLNKKIYARKCIIKELKFNLIRKFLDENHLQGSASSNINLGLFYKGELVQVMTFSKPRFNKNYQYELIRLCTKKFTNVVGGASKLFSYFIKNYNPESIISYANRRFSRGSIYEKLGFKFLRTTEPNYFYFLSDDLTIDAKNTKLLSRNKFQKHKLKNLLESYDPNLTEAENMFNNNYRRVFDSGNLTYIYERK